MAFGVMVGEVDATMSGARASWDGSTSNTMRVPATLFPQLPFAFMPLHSTCRDGSYDLETMSRCDFKPVCTFVTSLTFRF